jgi:Fic family protein
MIETPQRIEPALLEDLPVGIADRAAEISSIAAKLENALAPGTAAGLADMVRIMNCYYSNLIEGHKTRPRDIENALQSSSYGATEIPSTSQIERALQEGAELEARNRDLLAEAVAHVRVQRDIDRQFLPGQFLEPASSEFIKILHLEFYRGSSSAMLAIGSGVSSYEMVPGEWRTRDDQDVVVGRHIPPSSDRVADFMSYFASRYRFLPMGKSARIVAMAASHHRFNYIHPFPDGNGRVSRLMSHAMGHAAGIGAHGLWSVSRGLARGLRSRTDYRSMMDHADMVRQGDLDGRGNLSLRALVTFVAWFLDVCLDQLAFMSEIFELDRLAARLDACVDRNSALKPEAKRLLQEALIRGEFPRGDAGRITGLPERSARRVLSSVIDEGLLSSETEKGAVSLRFPMKLQDILFPSLFAES